MAVKRPAKSRKPKAVRKNPPSKSQIERTRTQFRALILANPNYFGNVKLSPFKPVLSIQSNTTYEEIGCVGFQPQFNRLGAVVYVKQSAGYGGNICSSGTQEYVRFYLSFDNGANWEDQGLTAFTVYDIPKGTAGQQRLEYSASLEIDPGKKFCFSENLALVRAILSWNVPPPADDPDHEPVWGNVHDTHIQIDPFKLIILDDIFKVLEVGIPEQLSAALDTSQSVAAAEPKVLTTVELKRIYQGKGVEPHRYAFAELQQLLSEPEQTPTLMAPDFPGVLADLDIDLADIVAKLVSADGDTRYEELECIGLNTNEDTLVGIIRVKLSSGYSGDLCKAGSKEYVTFWADFNDNGTFETCLGTASVTVHDIDSIPPEGLEYAVFLPVDLTHHHQPCVDGPTVVRICAILSWQVPPPCANPNFVPVWGNREETLIHITPGPKLPVGTVVPTLSILGGIPVSMIDNFTGMTTSNAIFALNGLKADSMGLGRACPFGRRLTVQAPQFFGYKYRVQVRKLPVGPWITVATPLKVTDLNGIVSDHFADPSTGLFEYLPFQDNIANVLAWWDTSGDDRWLVRLQIFDMADNLLPGVAWHRIQLDNTHADAEIHIDTGIGDCGKFTVGDMITGHFVARDDNFRSYSLTVKPGINAAGVGVPAPTGGTTQTVVAPGDPWSLNTAGMKSCGYIIEVVARDLAILNSVYGSNHWASDAAGFCIDEPAG